MKDQEYVDGNYHSAITNRYLKKRKIDETI
jgi:hypothetical protein